MNKEELTKYGFREDFDWENRFDLKTKVEYKGKTYEVSTVDLGLNHNFGMGKPLYYETMIFLVDDEKDMFERDNKNEFSEFQLRYSTEEEAKEMHEHIVKLFNEFPEILSNKILEELK